MHNWKDPSQVWTATTATQMTWQQKGVKVPDMPHTQLSSSGQYQSQSQKK